MAAQMSDLAMPPDGGRPAMAWAEFGAVSHRTGGALVWFTTYGAPGDSIEQPDERILALMGEIMPQLPPYLGR